MSIRIRDVVDDDFDAIARITNHYIAQTAIHFGMQPVTPDELRVRDVKFPYVVALDSREQLVGYAKAGTFRARAAYDGTAEIGVYIDDAMRGQGVGRALYDVLIERCRNAGFHTLVAGIALPNDASVALHERLGFVKVGVFKEVGHKFGRYHDVGFWQLMFGRTA